MLLVYLYDKSIQKNIKDNFYSITEYIVALSCLATFA
jgi:hypothetical protein